MRGHSGVVRQPNSCLKHISSNLIQLPGRQHVGGKRIIVESRRQHDSALPSADLWGETVALTLVDSGALVKNRHLDTAGSFLLVAGALGGSGGNIHAVVLSGICVSGVALTCISKAWWI